MPQCNLCKDSCFEFVQAGMTAHAAATMVSTDPKVWVVDDYLPPEFVQMVNQKFDTQDIQCQVVEKPNRKVLARNYDFDAKDELCQEVFRRISDLCGLPAGAVHFKEFMVSELWASGQDAHVDHVNLDDVANSNQLSFLDLSRQSCSESNPRRVVPTISIIIYFNAVGGLCFPKSDMGSIAAKPGRMVLFHNYEDELRPCHKPSAAHCGIYFEKLPKRVLVMGVLANETPQFQGTPPPSAEALIYCAGTQRDPLFHDHPSYDCYKRAPDDGKPKPELVLTLELICSEDNMLVNCRNTAGESLCNLVLAPTQTLEIARCHIQYWADRYSSYNIILALPGGQLLSKEHDSLTLSNLSELEGAASSSDQPQPAEPSPPDQEPARHTGSGSCCSQT